VKFEDLKSLPENQYLSKFLAAKYLNMTIFEFDDFVTNHGIHCHHIDKFGDKFKISEIVAAIENRTTDGTVKPIGDSGMDKLPPERADNEMSQELYSYTVEISHLLAQEDGYIQIPRKEITLFEKVPLFQKGTNNQFVLYKPANSRLPDERITDYRCPVLYYHDLDQADALVEKMTRYNHILSSFLNECNLAGAQKVLVDIFTSAVVNTEPSVLVEMRNSVDATVRFYPKETNTLDMMCNVIGLGKGVSEHSVNIMGLAIKFCKSNEYSIEDTVDIAFSALLHDIGKTKLEFHGISENGIVPADEENKKIFQQHCELGASIIDQCNFSNSSIRLGALEHHERLDGSGFPTGSKKLSFYGQLIGMIHFFESQMDNSSDVHIQGKPLAILKRLKQEVDAGKYNNQLFKQFAYSLL